ALPGSPWGLLKQDSQGVGGVATPVVSEVEPRLSHGISPFRTLSARAGPVRRSEYGLDHRRAPATGGWLAGASRQCQAAAMRLVAVLLDGPANGQEREFADDEFDSPPPEVAVGVDGVD